MLSSFSFVRALFLLVCTIFLNVQDFLMGHTPMAGVPKKKKLVQYMGYLTLFLSSNQDQRETTAMVKKLVLVKREARLSGKKACFERSNHCN